MTLAIQTEAPLLLMPIEHPLAIERAPDAFMATRPRELEAADFALAMYAVELASQLDAAFAALARMAAELAQTTRASATATRFQFHRAGLPLVTRYAPLTAGQRHEHAAKRAARALGLDGRTLAQREQGQRRMHDVRVDLSPGCVVFDMGDDLRAGERVTL